MSELIINLSIVHDNPELLEIIQRKVEDIVTDAQLNQADIEGEFFIEGE